MVGNDLFKVESNISLSNDTYKSLILFYYPLVGADAIYLYQYLIVKENRNAFVEISALLNSLSISIDRFEKSLKRLNEYKLIKTYKENNNDKYILKLLSPLTMNEFINSNVFNRDFIQKTSGPYYQSIVSDLKVEIDLKNYTDVSYKLSSKVLDNWTYDNEKYLKPIAKKKHNFNTIFDIDKFLDGVSFTLFPHACRTEENLKLIAELADLYDINYKKMKEYISEVIKYKDQVLDVNLLKYKCQASVQEFRKVSSGTYSVSCTIFLMNKQNAKDVTPYDKKILGSLSIDYGLNAEVINTLVEYCLNTCDNRLIEKFIYPTASDLHRNNIETHEQAKEFLNKKYKKNSKLSTKVNYDDIKSTVDIDALKKEIELKKRGNKR